MDELTVAGPDKTTEFTAAIVSSYLAHNQMQPNEVPGLITSVHQSLRGLGMSATAVTVAEKQTPAVPVRKSITPEYLVCLEDGKKLKMLKRHLRTTYNLSPEEYRAKWGLGGDYPMVAPQYAERRSALAKQNGLGTQRGKRPGRPAAKKPVSKGKRAAA
jgi:predicted transcriptional regulator